MKALLIVCITLSRATLPLLAQVQPDSDSVRLQRARMVAQQTLDYNNRIFTRADTLRGSITPERAWWDVQRYDLSIEPDFKTHSTIGHNLITYKVTSQNQPGLQLDLKAPLQIDSLYFENHTKLNFEREGDLWHIHTPSQPVGTIQKLEVFFHGKPIIAERPPWSGGWIFVKDTLGRPWMTVCCQGDGASLWYPCKDHQSDEPDKGASLTITAPDSLVVVSNGRQIFKRPNLDGTSTTKWAVINPISNYCLIPYIGKYVNFKETLQGENGLLDLNYWVLDNHLAKAKAYLPSEVHFMLKSMEYWFGPYPFYKDGYKLVEVQHTGMEHQSAVAYGNHFAPGYRGRDLSGTGQGLKWDFIIVHESGHEWFGNNITTKDLADMWVHESFANYSETLYVEYRWGKEAGNDYNFGIRHNITNDRPIIPHYGVNQSGSGDMYYKGSNMIHAIRHSINDDRLFREILRGLNSHFYHQTVTGQQIEAYISKRAGFDYQQVFDQYLKTTKIPVLELRFHKDSAKVDYRWTNCQKGFNLPLVLKQHSNQIKIYPTTNWHSKAICVSQRSLFNKRSVIKDYYIQVRASNAD